MPDSTGLYIHIPFCAKKCLYCDFYSACFNKKVYEDYLAALIRSIKEWGKKLSKTVDTVYIGGGTPSLLGNDIIPLMSAVRENFSVAPYAEITAECNPNTDIGFMKAAKTAGVNRLSIGVQAGDDGRLMLLGRTHTAADSRAAVSAARETGFDNISCDIMISLPQSNLKTLAQDIGFICSLKPEHISAYILKIEKNTVFFRDKERLALPDEDESADQYIFTSDELEKHGYRHYEISNFALKGKESRHNLKYWRCEEYLGIGPSAHSYLDGKRFYYPRDIRAFIRGNNPEPDGVGGDPSERIMLGLRLSEGVKISDFGYDITGKAAKLKNAGLVRLSGERLSLTVKGMLVSNSIITELLNENV